VTRATTILGATYPGRPMFGSFALRVWLTERQEGEAAARAHVAAHRALCGCGKPEHDFADDMTPVPMEGVVTCPAEQLTGCVGDPLLKARAA
jgi:hypothetical protein